MHNILKRSARFLIWIFLVLLLLIATVTVLYWAPDRPVSQLQVNWAPAPSTFMAIEGMSVHVRDEGPRADRSPLILLHGTSSSLHTWEGWVVGLRSQRRVISVDLPGYGLTGPFIDGDYRLEHYTRFLTELLHKIDVKHAVLVGNSFGGQVALEFTLAKPDLVDQLILIDALGYPRNATSVPLGFRIAQTPGLNKWMQYILPRPMVEDSVRNVFGNPDHVTPALVDRYYDLTTREGNRAALPERFKFLPTTQSARRIKNIKKPTLILWGGRDRLIPPDNARRFQRDIQDSQLVLFPELGHVPQEEDPSATLAVAKVFLGM